MTLGPIEGKKYLHNGQVLDSPDFDPAAGRPMYYEVVRLIGGQILFLNDHLLRLQQSLKDSGIGYPGDELIIDSLTKLLRSNQISKGNIRICILDSVAGSDLLCYFIPYHYPQASEYQEGVRLITYPHERPQPGIKKWDNSFRTEVKKIIREKQVYEALLVNHKNEITEGSRSNIFFVNEAHSLLTPPENQVLPGISRKYVIQCARDAGIEVREVPLDLQSALSMPACFISGTSPMVLPVRQIDNQYFQGDHPRIREVMEKYEDLLKLNLKTIS